VLAHILLHLFLHSDEWSFSTEGLRTKQARSLLERGRVLLRQGLLDVADAQFGAAMRLDPSLVGKLRKQMRRDLLSEFEGRGGGLNATHIWMQLKQMDKRSV